MIIAFDTLGENPIKPSSAINYLIEFVKFSSKQDKIKILLFVSNKNKTLFPKSNNIRLVNCFFSNENIILRILAQQILIPIYLIYYKANIMYSPINSAPLLTHIPVFLKINTLHHLYVKTQYDKNLFNIITSVLRKLYRTVFFHLSVKKSRIIFANSNYTKNQLIKYYNLDSNRIVISYEAPYEQFGLYDKKYSQKYVIDKFKIDFDYFIYPANIYSYKNHMGAIEIYNRFLEKYKKYEIKLLFVGRDEDNIKDKLFRKSNDLNIEKAIHYIDFVDIDDIVHLLNHSKALLFPSTMETFGKPIVEAMVSLTPVVASDIEPINELTVDNLLLAHPTDIDNFSNKLYNALNIDSQYLLKAKSKAKYFTYDNHFKNIFNTFEKLN